MIYYIITLKRSPHRCRAIKTMLDKTGFRYSLVEGIDGTMHNALTSDAPNWRYPHPLTAEEIGCYLSHRKCWKAFCDSGVQWAVFLEDDCQISEAGIKLLDDDDISREFQKFHLIQFQINPVLRNQHFYVEKSFPLRNFKFCLTRCSPSIGASCYFMDRQTALDAISLSEPIQMPIDNFLFGVFSPFSRIYPTYRCVPAIAKPSGDELEALIPHGAHNRTFYEADPRRLLFKIRIAFQRRRLCRCRWSHNA